MWLYVLTAVGEEYCRKMSEKRNKNSIDVFLALVRAGLWKEVDDNDNLNETLFEDLDWDMVQKLAEEQSVIGLMAAGFDKLTECRFPFVEKLKLLGKCQLIEHGNVAMNQFIAGLVNQLNKNGINALLVKGQGIAQCYEKSLWRSAGDIDLLLDEENYENAKRILVPIADRVEKENRKAKHLGLNFRGFTVELHGRMPFEPSFRVERVVDDVIASLFRGKKFRVWQNGNTTVSLLDPDSDVIIVFTHFLHHFFIEGVGLKQICDWCRLLWTYRDEIDRGLLEERLGRMGLMSEWKAFASLAVNHLGMPEEAMPFYDKRYRRRGEKILSHVLKSGNLGHNNNQKYRSKLSKPLANTVTFFRRIGDFAKFAFIFPVDSPKFFITYVFSKFKKSAA